MKQGDYVVFKKGTGLAGSVAKVITQEQQILRVRILHSTNSTYAKNNRVVATEYQLDLIDPKVGEILDN